MGQNTSPFMTDFILRSAVSKKKEKKKRKLCAGVRAPLPAILWNICFHLPKASGAAGGSGAQALPTTTTTLKWQVKLSACLNNLRGRTFYTAGMSGGRRLKRRRRETTWILAGGSGVAAAAAAAAERWLSGSLSELIWRLSFIASLLLCLTGRCRERGG